MKILVNTNKEVIFKSEMMDEVIEDGQKYWYYSENSRIFDNEYRCFEVESVPEPLQKYCYTEEKGFHLNPNWIEPPKSNEELILKLQKENASLKSELSLLQEVVNEMLLGI